VDQSEIIAQARVVYERAQAQLLAESPLSGMAAWLASGSPPRAAVLRSAGFTAETASPHLRLARKAFIREWGFSIPCAEAVDALRQLGPLVEVGAGTGYWSALLRNAGLDVIATDIQADGDIGYGFRPARHAPVEALGAVEAVERYPTRSVLCSWPTEGAAWALDAARSVAPGLCFALIGDKPDGVTATPELYAYLADCFSLVHEVQIPQFPQVHDSMAIYHRR
jgi:hypothetical protein